LKDRTHLHRRGFSPGTAWLSGGGGIRTLERPVTSSGFRNRFESGICRDSSARAPVCAPFARRSCRGQSTPSLPWSHPPATVLPCLSPFSALAHLPPVATARLHKGSILGCLAWLHVRAPRGGHLAWAVVVAPARAAGSGRVTARCEPCKYSRKEKSCCAGLLQSPLADSNRRPPPYHVLSAAGPSPVARDY
jgi:hypothetical protein